MNKRRGRLGKCYMLAVQYLLDDSPNFLDDGPYSEKTLVHGTIQHGKLPSNPHAWVEWQDKGQIIVDKIDDQVFELFDGRYVWEPASNKIYPRIVFYAMFRATAFHYYSHRQMWKCVVETMQYGPWEGDYWKLEKVGRKKVVSGRS